MKPIFLLLSFILYAEFLFCFEPQNGDIFFQESSGTDFTDAINNVTQSWQDKKFTHCGICYVDSSLTPPQSFIIEALPGAGVVITPLKEFLNRCLDKSNYPKVTVCRIIEQYAYTAENAVKLAKNFVGAAYDYNFDFNNEQIYCSELVYFAFIDNTGNSIFPSTSMTFNLPDTNITDPKWLAYFEKLGVEVPEGKVGVNPGGLSRSNLINIILDYKEK